jgi:predicted nucleic acid-binding protein
VSELWQSGRGCLSVQVLQEFYVVVTRKLTPVPFAELRLILSDLALWRIHAPVAADVLAAADLQQRYQVSFWDAMILHSAARLNCTTVWSEDLNPGQAYQGVHVMNPFVVTTE